MDVEKKHTKKRVCWGTRVGKSFQEESRKVLQNMDILFQNDFFSYQIKGSCKGLCHYDKGPTKDTCAKGGSPERHSGLCEAYFPMELSCVCSQPG